jgi:hypothetical protein
MVSTFESEIERSRRNEDEQSEGLPVVPSGSATRKLPQDGLLGELVAGPTCDIESSEPPS